MNKERKPASACRASRAEILTEYRDITGTEHIRDLLNALPYIAGVLNYHRQIVFANQALLDLLGGVDPESMLGRRPGEALGCIHSKETPGGCGTSPACAVCGAVEAIVGSFEQGEKITRECRITARIADKIVSFDLLVTASPFKIKGTLYTFLSLLDISGEKRRRALERIFFHDLVNTAGGVKGLIEVLRQAEGEESQVLLSELGLAVNNLMDEILSHRELAAAERGDLTVKPVPVLSLNILQETAIQFFHHPVAEGKSVVIQADSESFILETDEVLLKRVLGNMVKNALEASRRGARVILSGRRTGGRARFSVHNPGHVPEDVRFQIFQRSFSTKGNGRGLGTYSMRLIGEFYLKGVVSFISSPEGGTTFFIDLPMNGGEA